MAQTCYRHPNRETGVSCSSCGRPICPECMTPTPVGMRCPECSRQRTRVVRNPHGSASGFWANPATFTLIAINVVVYLIEVAGGSGGINNPSGKIVLDYGLFGPFVAEGEWYRLVTAGFLHASIFHIGFNMLLLFLLGRLLEPALGTPRFLVLYFASLLAGSLGVMIIDPNGLTLGASGAVFGLFSSGFILARERGLNELAGQLAFLIVINLVFSFTGSNISVGGHLGGLVGGVICALVIVAGGRGKLGRKPRNVELLLMGLVGAVSAVAAIAIA
ncbi:MAG: rhomboid family intramembrane serine protease [Actinobacteria bacterium]|nr:rhomboid family intramembrane serine protease [Actinomycetota bacterium]